MSNIYYFFSSFRVWTTTFMLIPTLVFPLRAQILEAKGVFVSTNNLKPVPYVHLQFKKYNIGTVANQEGAFSFTYDATMAEDTISVSAVGFEAIQLSARQLSQQDTILLKEAVVELAGLIVTPMRAEEVIRKSIAAIPNNYIADASYQGFFRAASKECGTYTSLNEGPLTFNDPGLASSDSIQLTCYKANRNSNFKKYNLADSSTINQALSFEHIRNRQGFLNLQNLDSWRFNFSGASQYEGQDVYVIEASYISDERRMKHTAELYVGVDNYAIYKIKYAYHWSERYFRKTYIDSLLEADHDWKGEFHYAYSTDKLYLKYFVFHHSKVAYDHVYKRKVCELEVHNEFITQFVAPASKHEPPNTPCSGSAKDYLPPETELYHNILSDLNALKDSDSSP
ncbi:carboxypeptidase-like regulatory domain-containing protein [Porifericola rhodea]|uniref:carboxypeptidase-like regulatory domain-containing protein n=1 Tax=Porifericola rhodea TaxID=930972 RepID=UPI00266619D0|nr:carboxypeptidase-like regulatory domain-containing protein [Porifericola rhodea]WKN30112.1 carboxypeptidase-like regulatory domain-containing protein [Porifericola rhodea]